MAEDPGPATLAAIIEAMRQAFNFVVDTAKAVVHGAVDWYRTRMYMSYRNQATQAQSQDPLVHGKQTIDQLRRHEDRGAHIVTVEVGDRRSRRALERELNAVQIDYAVTRRRGGTYLFHYKATNEQDVLIAQQRALECLYGIPQQALSLDDAPAQKQEPLSQAETRTTREQEASQEQMRAQAPSASYSRPEGVRQPSERAEQAAPVNAVKAERTTSQTSKAQSVSDTVKMGARRQGRQEPQQAADADRAQSQRQNVGLDRDRQARTPRQAARQSQRGATAQTRPAASLNSFEDIKHEARNRAAAKNRARDRNRERARDRMKNRTRAREFDHGR